MSSRGAAPASRVHRGGFNADDTKSPGFSGQPVGSRRGRRSWRKSLARRRAAAGDDHDPASPHDPAMCLAPLYIAGDLLRAEGFTEVLYVAPQHSRPNESVSHGVIDFNLLIPGLGRLSPGCRRPVTVVAGVHSGCFELFVQEPIRTISDLKDKRVGVQDIGHAPHLYLVIMAAHVGLDPEKDIEWVTSRQQPHGAVRRTKGRCYLALRPSRRSCAPAGRPRDPQHRRGQAMVTVLLLYSGRQHAHSSASIRSRPSVSCARSSRLPISAPTNQRGRRSVWSMADSRRD